MIINYTIMLLSQRLEELEQQLLEAGSMVDKAAIVHELAHVRHAIADQHEEW